MSAAEHSRIDELFPSRGAIAQLGERLVRNEEVSGSIPLISTKLTSSEFHKHPQVNVNTNVIARSRSRDVQNGLLTSEPAGSADEPSGERSVS